MKNLKRNIAIVCGGDSSEHDVSLRSAQGLYSFFDKERYNVYIVDVKGVDWQVELPGGTTTRIDRNDFSFVENARQSCSIMPTSLFMAPQVRMACCKDIST